MTVTGRRTVYAIPVDAGQVIDMDEKDDILVKTSPLLEIASTPWRNFLSSDIHTSEIELFRKHERTDRPLGKTTFLKQFPVIHLQ